MQTVKRTRKWAFVEQEATRLAGLGLSAQDIAKRLEVDRSTVTRWMQQGKLPKGPASGGGPTVKAPQSPEEWARDVRQTYALDATDDQLVTLGQTALMAAHDPKATVAMRLQAMGRFQAIVKQLALVARRQADEAPKDETKPTVQARPARRPGTDPRNLLMAVS